MSKKRVEYGSSGLEKLFCSEGEKVLKQRNYKTILLSTSSGRGLPEQVGPTSSGRRLPIHVGSNSLSRGLPER